MTRRYQGPKDTSIEAAERMFANGSDDEICQLMVDLAFSPDVDPDYTATQCLRLLETDHWYHWGIAAVCLGHLLPRYAVDLSEALPLLEKRATHPEIGDQVCDGLSSLRHSHPGLRAHTIAKHRAGVAERIRQWLAGRVEISWLYMEICHYGIDEEFAQFLAMLEPFESPNEPTGEARMAIEVEARSVLQRIESSRSFAPLIIDERILLRDRILDPRKRPGDVDPILDFEQDLAKAALSLAEAEAALREIHESGSLSEATRDRLLERLERG